MSNDSSILSVDRVNTIEESLEVEAAFERTMLDGI